MNVLARAGVCWLVLACFSMTGTTVTLPEFTHNVFTNIETYFTKAAGGIGK